MYFGKLLKEIRNEKGDSLITFGEKLGVSHSYIDQVEKGSSKPSKKFLEKSMEVFPYHRSKLLKEFFKDEMPDSVFNELKKEMRLEVKDEIIEVKSVKIPVYGLASAGSGAYNMENVELLELVLPEELKDRKNLFGLKVHGDSMEPRFLKDDILVLDDCIPAMEELHNKEVVVQLNNENFIKQLKYVNFTPFLYSYSPAYAPIEINGHDEVKIIGRLVFLIRKFV